MSPDPNFIPPRLSEAIHLPGWIPGKGGIKSLKHKQRKRDKKGGIVKEGRITKEKGKCRMYENTERKKRKCRRLKNIGEEQRNRTADKEGFI